MIRFSSKVGLRFRENELGWELCRRLATGKIQFQSDTGELLNLTDRELRGRWLSPLPDTTAAERCLAPAEVPTTRVTTSSIIFQLK